MHDNQHKQTEKPSQWPSSPLNHSFMSNPLAERLLAPGNAQIVMAEWIAEGAPEDSKPQFIAPLHLHKHDDEAWYVLEGSLGFRIGSDT